MLDDLGDQLREAAARESRSRPRSSPASPSASGAAGRRQWLLVTLGALVTFGGVAVAERALDRTRPRRARRTRFPATSRPPPTRDRHQQRGGGPGRRAAMGAARLHERGRAGLRRARPADERQARDLRPVAHVPRAAHPRRPASASRSPVRACSSPSSAARWRRPRTIVFGMARDRRPVRVTMGGETRTVTPGGLGTFVDVRTGLWRPARHRGVHDGRTDARSSASWAAARRPSSAVRRSARPPMRPRGARSRRPPRPCPAARPTRAPSDRRARP